MKRFLAFTGIVIALLLAVIVMIPFVVDIDHFRPEIELSINQHFNGQRLNGQHKPSRSLGTVKLGKLSLVLSHILEGQVQINADRAEFQGFSTSGENLELIEVKKIVFQFPLKSLWDENQKAFSSHFALWGGAVQSHGLIQLNTEMPLYQFELKASGIDINQFLRSQRQLPKDPVTGNIDFEISGMVLALTETLH